MNKEALIDYNNYEITEDGKIFSKCFNKKCYLNGSICPDGYIRLSFICTDGKRRNFYYHRVIWYYFNGEIPLGMQVNHIDEDKTNNALSNLNLMTPKQNSNWGTRIERVSTARTNLPSMSKKVEQIDKTTGEVIAVFPSTHEVERQLKFDNAPIVKCCRNKQKTAYGYTWKYKNDQPN